MKESTKDKKAMAEFKMIAKSCKSNYVSLFDHALTIADTNYNCQVIMEDMECVVYKNYGGLDCYEVESFNI